MPVFSYRSFGLNVSSDIECTGALPVVGHPDVSIRLGQVPELIENPSGAGPFYEAAHGALLLNVTGIGRYLVSGGNQIVVDPAPDAEQGTVSLLLLGSAFGALLQQRQIVTLHGSAIAGGNGAVVFAGASGWGKSTLAAAFHQRGYQVLADEICPIQVRALPVVLPANPFLLLSADAAEGLGLSHRRLRQARVGIEKYILPIDRNFGVDPLPLQAIYILEPAHSETFSITPLRGLAKIRMLSAVCYKPHFIEGMRLEKQHSRLIAEVARGAKVSVVKRPTTGFRVDELADFIAADFTS